MSDHPSRNHQEQPQSVIRLEPGQTALDAARAIDAPQWVLAVLEENRRRGEAVLAEERMIHQLCQEHGLTREQARGMMVGALANSLRRPNISLPIIPAALENLSRALRQLLAYLLAHHGVDVETVRDHMGHADNSQTYTQLSRLRKESRRLLRGQPFRLECLTEKGRITCTIREKTTKR